MGVNGPSHSKPLRRHDECYGDVASVDRLCDAPHRDCSDYYFDRGAFSFTSFSQSSASLELDRDAFSEVFMIPLSPANSSGVSWSKLARSGGFEVKLISSAVGARECCGSQFDIHRGHKTHSKSVRATNWRLSDGHHCRTDSGHHGCSSP